MGSRWSLANNRRTRIVPFWGVGLEPTATRIRGENSCRRSMETAPLGQPTRLVRHCTAISLGSLIHNRLARSSLKRPSHFQWPVAPERPVLDAGSSYGSFDLLSSRRLLARRVSQIRKITKGRYGQAPN